MWTKRKWVNWMLRWLGYLWPWLLTLTVDLEFSRSNWISGMGGPIVMEWKGRESIRCPDVKHYHYVTSRQKILLKRPCCITWYTHTHTHIYIHISTYIYIYIYIYYMILDGWPFNIDYIGRRKLYWTRRSRVQYSLSESNIIYIGRSTIQY